MNDQDQRATNIEKWVDELHDIRLKRGTDYAYTSKYGKLHVVCCRVFEASVREVAAKNNVVIDDMFLYD